MKFPLRWVSTEDRAELANRMRKLYEDDGLSQAILARRFGYSQHLIHKLLKEAGTTFRE